MHETKPKLCYRYLPQKIAVSAFALSKMFYFKSSTILIQRFVWGAMDHVGGALDQLSTDPRVN